MSIPKVRDETSVPSRTSGRQAVVDNEGAGMRIKEALKDREVSWLSKETGYGDSTIRDAIRRGPARTDVAVAIAKALKVSTDWLLCGVAPKPQGGLVEANHADWVEVPEYNLRELTDHSRGPVVSVTPIRRDWLYSALGETSGIWLARTLADWSLPGVPVSAPIFCRDHPNGERPIEGKHYLLVINGGVIIARFSYRGVDHYPGEQIVTPRNLYDEDVPHFIVARVLGAMARPL